VFLTAIPVPPRSFEMQSNPYQSPGEIRPGGFVPAKSARPASVTVFGILNLVFGALGLCGTVASAAMLFLMPQNPNMPNPVLELMAENPAFRLFNQVATGLAFIAAIVLQNGRRIVTGNPRHFQRVPDLEVIEFS